MYSRSMFDTPWESFPRRSDATSTSAHSMAASLSIPTHRNMASTASRSTGSGTTTCAESGTTKRCSTIEPRPQLGGVSPETPGPPQPPRRPGRGDTTRCALCAVRCWLAVHRAALLDGRRLPADP
jgi:hypothetical protein